MKFPLRLHTWHDGRIDDADGNTIASCYGNVLDAKTIVDKVNSLEQMCATAWELRERGQKAHDLLVEFINLGYICDIDENSDDGYGWGKVIRDAKVFCGLPVAPQPVEGE